MTESVISSAKSLNSTIKFSKTITFLLRIIVVSFSNELYKDNGSMQKEKNIMSMII